MKFTWKPIKDLNALPRGIEVMVCIENKYCDYIRRASTVDKDPDAWFYVYTSSQIQEHKLKAFTHYFIPRPAIPNTTPIKDELEDKIL